MEVVWHRGGWKLVWSTTTEKNTADTKETRLGWASQPRVAANTHYLLRSSPPLRLWGTVKPRKTLKTQRRRLSSDLWLNYKLEVVLWKSDKTHRIPVIKLLSDLYSFHTHFKKIDGNQKYSCLATVIKLKATAFCNTDIEQSNKEILQD